MRSLTLSFKVVLEAKNKHDDLFYQLDARKCVKLLVEFQSRSILYNHDISK